MDQDAWIFFFLLIGNTSTTVGGGVEGALLLYFVVHNCTLLCSHPKPEPTFHQVG